MTDKSVNIQQLKKLVNQALDSLEEEKGETVELGYDYFWSIRREDLYDPYAEPKPDKMTVGQISESWSFTKNNENEEFVPPHDLTYIADVLRALGHQFG